MVCLGAEIPKVPSALGVNCRTAYTRRLRGGAQARKGRGQAWSVRAPIRAAALSFPLGRGRRTGFEAPSALRAWRQRPRTRLPALRGGAGEVPAELDHFLFLPGTRLCARVYKSASGHSALCVPPRGPPIPVASVHCRAQPSGRRGLGLQVIPEGHLPLPHPVDAASSSPPCLLLNRIL